jgi:hypothetical protein
MAICPLFERYVLGEHSPNQTRRKVKVVVACTRICITERQRAQLLPPNIESIEYVYIMHARSVMQQKKGRKKGKAEGKERRWKI